MPYLYFYTGFVRPDIPRLYLSEDEFKTVRRMELNGILRTLHHANVVGGYLVDDRKPKRKNARKNKEEM